jgi:hypothetical protein
MHRCNQKVSILCVTVYSEYFFLTNVIQYPVGLGDNTNFTSSQYA